FGVLLRHVRFKIASAPDAWLTNYKSFAMTSYVHGIDYYISGLQIAGAGTLMGGINFIATIVNMRAPGITYMRMPMFTWATFITSVLILFAFPALTINLFLIMFVFIFGSAFFDVSLVVNSIIYQV